MALYFEENLEIYVEKLYFMKKEAFLSSISFESIIIRAEVKKKNNFKSNLFRERQWVHDSWSVSW